MTAHSSSFGLTPRALATSGMLFTGIVLAACGTEPASSVAGSASDQQTQKTSAASPSNAASPPPATSTVASTSAVAAPPSKIGDTRTRERDGATMVFVPAGEFVFGSPKDVGDADEFPQRRITLSSFFIDRLETTRAQFAACVDAGICKAPNAEDGAATKACNWPHADRKDHPINCVTYQDAADYCGWAGARLPTEAEWEKAARGADGRAYPWGNAAATCELAIVPTPAGITGCGAKTTGVVGSKPAGASPYGALDMSGNVWEWVSDFYVEDFYAKAPTTDPKGPAQGGARSLRGGAWEVHDMLHLRTANRYRFAPAKRFHALGIRCARDP